MMSLLALVAMVWLGGIVQAQTGSSGPEKPERTFAYSKEILDTFGAIPVQDGGRIKPLSTLAGFKMLRFYGKRSMKSGGLAPEETLNPEAWLLDCFFFPEQAKRYPNFVIQYKAVAVAIGLDLETKKKRDRYSYEELAPVRARLDQVAGAAFRKDSKERDLVERQVVNLWRNVSDFEDLCRFTAFAGNPLPTSALDSVSDLYGGRDPELPEFLALAPDFRQRVIGQESGPAWQALSDKIDSMARRNIGGLGIFPPQVDAEQEPEWMAWPEMITLCLQGDPAAMAEVPLMETLGRVVASKNDPAGFEAELSTFAGEIEARAKARGEYARIPMERDFYRYDFFYRALYAFVLGFLLIAFSWLRSGAGGKGSWLVRGAWVFSSLGWVLLTVGITYRCILRQRPPISTLYETILFIASVAVVTALFLEWTTRRRIGLAVASFLGALGMFMAGRYELREAATAGDTMPSLVAVLDTNYWLAIHVTTINIGYAAGMLAAALAHVWLGSFFFGKGRKDSGVRAELSRMVYGVLCFSLLFSVVGTILGGVWANDSWGRFWGWDPKENGALMICLWELLILHARMGGYIRQFGLAIMNVLLGLVVAFSWWGVNLLGVGLHSYGFTEGVGFWLTSFYGLELVIVGLALFAKYMQDRRQLVERT
ncbi:MAG: cytochrome c biogenesis protein CcsA [Planctomycetes bacterium]|nr:cytochrome c biogenesis protein CcsA [Planctomycetota bacterium]